ncbi:hypothetical protein [Thermoanaerobacter sp. RKWS2]|uniref:hypothetical protein n=1 Tax=Thermoanaerobacter sp. RKWS2 TaxID=2983842 RepID=UPI00224B3800|nr:hypothetical protein [Thermoanaerobacter sp. RKWS2]UZQ83950.1 hypothetical protein OEI98_001108 [Thermoanaerobacter sp. RKWS2]
MLNKLTNIRIDSACNSPSIKEHKSLLAFDFSLDIPSHQAEIHENTRLSNKGDGSFYLKKSDRRNRPLCLIINASGFLYPLLF